jgi:hypothetical protein
VVLTSWSSSATISPLFLIQKRVSCLLHLGCHFACLVDPSAA